MSSSIALSDIHQKIAAQSAFRIRAASINKIYEAKAPEELHDYLQNAIKLEHSTIPPYLTALYSIKPNSNQEIAKIILSVVRQEMLHMAIAANVLNALGGDPKLSESDFIPTYPGVLPMVEPQPGFEVGLAPLSLQVVKDVFMNIELPEDPQHFEDKQLRSVAGKSFLSARNKLQQEYGTIGQFYSAIMEMIDANPKWIISNRRQVTNPQWFPKELLFPIKDAKDAISALQIIVDQGEGTKKGENPLDAQGNLAHYYKFSEIAEGFRLVKDDLSGKFVYDTSQPVKLDEQNIWNLVTNSKAAYYKPGSVPYRLVDEFNYSYTSLLNGLHKTFNGEPNYLNTAMAVMFELKLQAERMVERPITDSDLVEGSSSKANAGQYVAPSFEYAPID